MAKVYGLATAMLEHYRTATDTHIARYRAQLEWAEKAGDWVTAEAARRAIARLSRLRDEHVARAAAVYAAGWAPAKEMQEYLYARYRDRPEILKIAEDQARRLARAYEEYRATVARIKRTEQTVLRSADSLRDMSRALRSFSEQLKALYGPPKWQARFQWNYWEREEFEKRLREWASGDTVALALDASKLSLEASRLEFDAVRERQRVEQLKPIASKDLEAALKRIYGLKALAEARPEFQAYKGLIEWDIEYLTDARRRIATASTVEAFSEAMRSGREAVLAAESLLARASWEQVSAQIAKIGEAISALLPPLLKETLAPPIEAITRAVGEAVKYILAGFQAWFNLLLRTYTKAFFQVLGIFMELWRRIMEFVKVELIPTLAEGMRFVYGIVVRPTVAQLTPVVHEVGSLIRGILDWAFGFLWRLAPLTPEKAWYSLTTLASYSILFSSGLAMGALLSKLRVMGFQIDFSGMVEPVANVLAPASLGALAAIALSAILQRESLAYYFRKRLRPSIPSERILRELRSMNLISSSLYRAMLEYHGYADEWMPLLEQLAKVVPSEIALGRMYGLGGIGLEDYLSGLRWYGYEDRWVRGFEWVNRWRPDLIRCEQLWLRGVIASSTLDELYRLYNIPAEWAKAFREGLFRPLTRYETRIIWEIAGMPDEEMATNLLQQGYRRRDLPRIITYIKGFTARTERMAIARSLARMYGDGLITLERFMDRLLQLRLRTEIGQWIKVRDLVE